MKKTRILVGLFMVGLVSLNISNAKFEGCDKNFYEKIRFGEEVRFYDEFSANSSDKWVTSYNITFNEPYDYNKYEPEFTNDSSLKMDWTQNIRNAKGKVAAGTTMRILQATGYNEGYYAIKAVPATRAFDNFGMKFVIGYSTNSTTKDTYTHTECLYYEITRCGDGTIDSSDGEVCDDGENNGKDGYCNASCTGKKEYCGDGIKNNGELCDPKDTSKTNWGNGGCSNTCEPITIDSPVCNSDYNGKRVTTLSATDNLCIKGDMTGFNYDSTNHKWTWKCNNVAGETSCSATKPYCGDEILDAGEVCDDGVNNGKDGYCNASCTGKKEYCGDGIKNNGESCDYNDKTQSGWGNGGCSNTCEPMTIDSPVCNSDYNGKRVTTLSATDNLCTKGDMTGFNYDSTNYKWTWKCDNAAGESSCFATKPYCGDEILDAGEVCDDGVNNGKDGYCNASCTGKKEYCGDGIKNNGEVCDYADSTEENRGTYGCNKKCERDIPSSQCDKNFYLTLRYGYKYTFWDTFSAGSVDRWLRRFNVKFTEEYDYNGGDNPSFYWIDSVKNSNGYIPAGSTDVRVVQSSPEYEINYIPKIRSYDNLYIEYNLGYANSSTEGSDIYRHKECVYYEISRCGDGKIDTGYNEVCDPKDTSKTNWGNGGCSNSCEPVKVDPPVCNSDYNGKRVTTLSATDNLCTKGDMTGFNYDSTNHKWTWKCENTAGESVSCSAIKPYCGDGILDNGETCDPNDTSKTNWGNGGCSPSTCEPIKIDPPVCNSEYNGKRVTTLSATDNLCTTGAMTGFNYDSTNHKWTWKCNNEAGELSCSAIKPYCGDGILDNGEMCDDGENNGKDGYCSATCTGKKEYCGDGIKNNGELCDYNDKTQSGWGSGGCSELCEPMNIEAECNSLYNGQVVSSLSESDPLCTKGTMTGFTFSNNVWTWQCEDKSGTGVNCSATKKNTPPPSSPKLWLTKTFTDGLKLKTVQIGDIVAYKVSFGNSGDATASITSIKDLLPQNVEYISSSITINALHGSGENITISGHSYSSVNGVYIDMFSGMSLNPGDSGFIILTGKVLSGFLDSRTNFACIYLNDTQIECDDATHNIENKTVYCSKPDSLSDVEICEGNSVSVEKTVTCKADSGTADSIIVLCDGVAVNSGENISQLDGKCTFTSLGSHTASCNVNGQSKNISGEDCLSSFNISTKSCGGGGGNDPYCKAQFSGIDKIREVKCGTDNDKTRLAQIDCGNGTVLLSSGAVKSFTGICDYTNASAGTYTIKCSIKQDRNGEGNWFNLSTCNSSITIKGGGGGGGGGKTVDPDPVKCFNTNAGNISIELGEYLPFFGNLEKLDKKEYKYTGEKQTLGTSCSKSDSNIIDLTSLKCTFKIYNGKNGDTPVYSIEGPCLEETSLFSNQLISSWMAYNIDNYVEGSSNYSNFNSFDIRRDRGFAFQSSIMYIPDFGLVKGKTSIGNFTITRHFDSDLDALGEYKLRLEKVDYLYCNGQKWTSATFNDRVNDRVCENDFVVTDPYTVQKTPSGTIKSKNSEGKSTDWLDNYYTYPDGNRLSRFIKSIASVDEYAPNDSIDSIKSAQQSFYNKYYKLSVKVSTNKFGNKVELRKVPGKNIYFVSGDIVISEGQKVLDSPTTFYQTSGKTTIKGSIGHNIMLLTNGDIVFSGSCNQRQVVKGIYYTSSKLQRAGIHKNDDLHNDWCSEGGLTIKGVVIGKGLGDLMKKSRSNLNNWFNVSSDGSNSERKNLIMNGASVLIEYSPSIFTVGSMPPGAEYFTTALSVYKD